MSRITTLEEFQQNYKTSMEIPVAWGEQDAFQHVNNIMYFRYFESVRMHYLGLTGGLDYLKARNIGPILASVDCKFIFPVTYPDTLLVATRIPLETLQKDRFAMDYAVWSKKLNRVCALGTSLIVYYDYQKLAKTDVPEVLEKAIRERES